MCIGLLRPAHTPKVKYSLSKLLLWLALSARIQWPFRTSTPSQREIFSLTAVIVVCSLCSYTVAFQDQHTLPKRNILSKLLLWLALCICVSGPAHPPKEKYSLKAVIVACSYGVSFQDQHTLPKRNILSKLLLWLARMEFPFQDQHTLPKRNILSQSCYCGLLSLLVYE